MRSRRQKPFSIGICRCCYWRILLVIVISVDSELFGDEDGVGSETSTDYSPDSFLARVKYQTEERRTKRQETQQPVEQASLENRGKFFALCTSDNDMHQQTEGMTCSRFSQTYPAKTPLRHSISLRCRRVEKIANQPLLESRMPKMMQV
jgi:hypothetical protein